MAGYKLATYKSADGPRAGLVIDDKMFDAAKLTGKAAYASVLGILEDWRAAQGALKKAAAKAAQEPGQGSAARPHQAAGSGALAFGHLLRRRQLCRPCRRDGAPHEPAAGPRSAYARASRHGTSSRRRARWPIPGATVKISDVSEQVDWEVELAAVIGRTAKNVSEAKALDYVAGYTIANDLSARDRGLRPNISDTSPFKNDWTKHKTFDGSCPLGPWIVPASDIGDPQNLGLKLWVNDVLKQDSNTKDMIFNLAEQIAQLSSGMTLHPGDLILTGTPAGVGSARGEFLKPGDVVKLWIEKIGTLTNKLA